MKEDQKKKKKAAEYKMNKLAADVLMKRNTCQQPPLLAFELK